MIASLSGRRRRGAPDDRSLGCVLRPSGLATVRGAREAPGPTYTRARGTKNEPTSGPAPLSTIDPFHPARVRLRPVGNLYTGSRHQERTDLSASAAVHYRPVSSGAGQAPPGGQLIPDLIDHAPPHRVGPDPFAIAPERNATFLASCVRTPNRGPMAARRGSVRRLRASTGPPN